MPYYRATMHVLLQADDAASANESVSEMMRQVCIDTVQTQFVSWEFVPATDGKSNYASARRVSTADVQIAAQVNGTMYDVPLHELDLRDE